MKNAVNVNKCKTFRKFEEPPMLFLMFWKILGITNAILFYTEPHNVVNVKNWEGCRKFEETPIMKPQMW